MENKYFLNEEDVRNLTEEQRRVYDRLMRNVMEGEQIFPADLSDFNEILREQYEKKNLYNPNISDQYFVILSKNLNNILNYIVNVRNDIVNEKRALNDNIFRDIHTSLDVLEKFIKTQLNRDTYSSYAGMSGYIGSDDLKNVLSRVEQLKSQLLQDMEFYQGFKDKKVSAKVKYMAQKDNYDKLSLFGKLVAKVNGTKKELKEANLNYNFYNVGGLGSPKPGEIYNPLRYEEYLKTVQSEDEIERVRK